MLCFAAAMPHSPLLLETIGKENVHKLESTRSAVAKLKDDLEASKPDAVLVISSHSIKHEDAFSINLHDEYHVDLKDFGDLTTTGTFVPDAQFITEIRRHLRNKLFPFTLDSSPTLDYGTAIPLLLLGVTSKIVPVSYSGLDRKMHAEFGRELKELIMRTDKRVAVIASGDLSHCLSSDAPVEFHKDGARFDEAIQEAVRQQSLSHMLNLNEDLLTNASECAYRPFLVLFGVMERVNSRPKIHSYESPFGVGYLVAQFHLL